MNSAANERDQQYPFVETEDLPGACDADDVPLTESLQNTMQRLLPFWDNTVAPAIQSGQQILIVASGNSIRVSLLHQMHCCKLI